MNKAEPAAPNPEEAYLGGISSARIRKGPLKGYGVYATNKRIIGVNILLLTRKPLLSWESSFALTFVSVFLVGTIIATLSRSFEPFPAVLIISSISSIIAQIAINRLSPAKFESIKTMEELERKKDFQAYKTQIRSITLTKPGLAHDGHLIVSLISGEIITIRHRGRKEFNKLKETMNAFNPEALNIIE